MIEARLSGQFEMRPLKTCLEYLCNFVAFMNDNP